MPVDLSKIEDRIRRQVDQERIARELQARFVVATGEKAEALLLGGDWQVWEEHTLALLEADERRLQALREAMDRPEVGGDALTALRNEAFMLRGRVAARREDLELPAELARRGKDAAAAPHETLDKPAQG